MKKVLITGSGGVIGTVLKQGLSHHNHQITDFDLPEHNVENYKQLLEKARGHDAIVHLAWDSEHETWLSENLDPDNVSQLFNIYQVAQEAGVRRVIIASSVHADNFAGRNPDDPLLQPYSLPTPDSPYGATKCMMEALGRYYADAKELEVVCIRFGGVNRLNQPPEHPYSERQVWFSHQDCVSLVQACIESPELPGDYAIVYGMSDNKDRLHDLSNPFGWQPVDGDH